MLPEAGDDTIKPMTQPLDSRALDVLFRTARTFNAWLPEPVSDQLIHDLYDLWKFGPTSLNMCPARIAFVKSEAAKQRLKPALMAGNVNQTMSAPVTAIIAYDLEFYEKLSTLFPFIDAKAMFVGKPEAIEDAAFRNGTLEGGYLMLAARALGLDCGPMSGFDRSKVDAEFFPGETWKSNFLCNLGYGDASKLRPRLPRLEFGETNRIL